MHCPDILVEKHPAKIDKLLGIFRSQILACAATPAAALYLRMPHEIIPESIGHYLALTHHPDPVGTRLRILP